MPTRIIKESQLRKIFKGKQIGEDAIQWLDDYVYEMMEKAHASIKDNPKVKRINVGLVKFIVNPNAIVICDHEHGDDLE